MDFDRDRSCMSLLGEARTDLESDEDSFLDRAEVDGISEVTIDQSVQSKQKPKSSKIKKEKSKPESQLEKDINDEIEVKEIEDPENAE